MCKLYNVTENNIHIYESHGYSKYIFREVLEWIKSLNPECKVFEHRSVFSLMMEWTVHNALYALHINRERTAEVDLNHPCEIPECVYWVLGVIVWPFMR